MFISLNNFRILRMESKTSPSRIERIISILYGYRSYISGKMAYSYSLKKIPKQQSLNKKKFK